MLSQTFENLYANLQKEEERANLMMADFLKSKFTPLSRKLAFSPKFQISLWTAKLLVMRVKYIALLKKFANTAQLGDMDGVRTEIIRQTEYLDEGVYGLGIYRGPLLKEYAEIIFKKHKKGQANVFSFVSLFVAHLVEEYGSGNLGEKLYLPKFYKNKAEFDKTTRNLVSVGASVVGQGQGGMQGRGDIIKTAKDLKTILLTEPKYDDGVLVQTKGNLLAEKVEEFLKRNKLDNNSDDEVRFRLAVESDNITKDYSLSKLNILWIVEAVQKVDDTMMARGYKERDIAKQGGFCSYVGVYEWTIGAADGTCQNIQY
eukprot:Platyproteum_vivax@DN5513_c0_g1_i1.p2